MAVGVDSYNHSIARLFERTAGRIEPGLGRTEELLEAIGNPERSFPSFHIAGTNGKGSTCATIDALLRAGGKRVGRYSSPHLVDFRERIVVDGEPISEAAVLSLLARLDPIAERINATFFEITTVMAFAYFAERKVDVAVVETGLGGALDSTNVVDPLVATVTNVSLDHTEYLGTTLGQIATEKAGIFQFGRPAVVGEPRADLARQLIDLAAGRGATPITSVRSDWRHWSVTLTGGGTSFIASTPLGELRLVTPLLGEHQAQNTLTALASVYAAGEPYAITGGPAINRALATVRLPGRFQRVGEWIFDVAHNAAAARVLAEALTLARPQRPVTMVIAILKDKDWESVIANLAGVVDSFIITQALSAPADRAWEPLKAASFAHGYKVPVLLEPHLASALERARTTPGTKVVTGSFHTVGDAMKILGIDPLTGGNTVAPDTLNR